MKALRVFLCAAILADPAAAAEILRIPADIGSAPVIAPGPLQNGLSAPAALVPQAGAALLSAPNLQIAPAPAVAAEEQVQAMAARADALGAELERASSAEVKFAADFFTGVRRLREKTLVSLLEHRIPVLTRLAAWRLRSKVSTHFWSEERAWAYGFIERNFPGASKDRVATLLGAARSRSPEIARLALGIIESETINEKLGADARAALAAALGGTRLDARRLAARLLSRQQDKEPALEAALKAALKDPDQEVRVQAFLGVMDSWNSLEDISTGLLVDAGAAIRDKYETREHLDQFFKKGALMEELAATLVAGPAERREPAFSILKFVASGQSRAAMLETLRQGLRGADETAADRAAEILSLMHKPKEFAASLVGDAVAGEPAVRRRALAVLKSHVEAQNGSISKPLLKGLLGLLDGESQGELKSLLLDILQTTASAAEVLGRLYPGEIDELLSLVPNLAKMTAQGLKASLFSTRAAVLEFMDYVRTEKPGDLAKVHSLRELTLSIPLEPARARFLSYGYRLPYAVPGLKTEKGQSPALLARVSPGGGPENNAALSKVFDSFNALIDANFRALGILAKNSGAMTKRTARAALEQVAAMAALYAELGAKDGAAVQAKFDALRAELSASWAGLAENGALPKALVRRLCVLESGEPPLEKIKNVNTLINFIHQAGLRRLQDIAQRGGGDGKIEIGESSISLLNLGREPLTRKARLHNRLLKLLAVKRVPAGHAIFKDDQLWYHARLGVHSVELHVKLAEPDEGGLLRMRYNEGGSSSGNRLRLAYLSSILSKLGIDSKTEGGQFLDVSWDKDHGLLSKAAIEEALPRILAALGNTYNLDLAFGYDTLKPGQKSGMAHALADIHLAEGGIDFYDGRHSSLGLRQSYLAYVKKDWERRAVAEALNGELRRLELPELPEGPLGQRVIDEKFSRPVALALARGELSADENGTPQRARYEPVDALAQRALADEAASTSVAAALATVEPGELAFEAIGAAGRLSAERAQKLWDDGSALNLYVLREPETGAIAYAWARLWDGRALADADAGAVVDWLNARGIDAGPGFAPGALQREQRRRALLRPPLAADADDGVSGLAASPGSGAPAVGRASFRKEGRAARHNGVFMAAYTTPDDLESIRRSAAVVTTGGGLLSHAAITTRELGLAAAIVSGARWTRQAGETVLEIDRKKPRPAVLGPAGVWLSRGVDTETLVVREGDWVRVDGRSGVVSVGARKARGVVGAARERLESLRAQDLEGFLSWYRGLSRGNQLAAAEYIMQEALWNPRLLSFQWKIFAGLWDDADPDVHLLLGKAARRLIEAELAFVAPALAQGRERVQAKGVSRLATAFSIWSPELGALNAGLQALEAESQKSQSAERSTRRAEVLELAGRAKALGLGELENLRRVLRQAWPGRGTSKKREVLFVCTNNTCRSPMAEYLSKDILRRKGETGVSVQSRGLSIFPGILSHGAKQALEEEGLSADAHRPQPMTPEEARRADVILAMSWEHAQILKADYPEAAGKVYLLNEYAALGGESIKDPAVEAIKLSQAYAPFGSWDFSWKGFARWWKNAEPDPLIPQALWDGNAFLREEVMAGYRQAAGDIKKGLVPALDWESALIALQKREAELTALLKTELARSKAAILPLGELNDDYVELVGGKAAKLGAIMRAVQKAGGYVPEGFALTTEAYLRFLKETGLEASVAEQAAELDRYLASADLSRQSVLDGIKERSARIRASILSARLDPSRGLGRELLEGLKAAGLENQVFAVRSSAVQEDGAEAAFAGAAETYLYVDKNDLLEKVVENWASFWLPRGIEYRRHQGILSSELRPAVTVQKMADAEAAGVMFTVNPVSGRKDIVINAAYGLGEGIVSGLVQADQYTADRAGAEIAAPVLGDKKVKVVRTASGRGTEVAAVPAKQRRARALSPEQIKKLAEIGAALEAHFGYPLDIEFAVENGRAAILQARPVTR